MLHTHLPCSPGSVNLVVCCRVSHGQSQIAGGDCRVVVPWSVRLMGGKEVLRPHLARVGRVRDTGGLYIWSCSLELVDESKSYW